MINKEIMVVDDEVLIRNLLSEAFNRVGYSVISVGSGEEALELLNHHDIEVFIVDLGLERMTGFDLCEHIRIHNPAAFIFALTGFCNLFGSGEILKAGFDNCFQKPFNVEHLYQSVGEAFEKIDR